MNIQLPSPISAFFQASNTRKTDDFLSFFTSNAIVTDEGKDYRGAAIKEWIDLATAEAKPISEVIDLTHQDGKMIVTAQVSGNFSGSPVRLRYDFTLKDNRIDVLAIEA